MAETTTTTEAADLDCCGPTEPTNPKQEIFRRRRTPVALQLYEIKNPIVDEVRDSTEIQTLFKRWNFVPFAGLTTASGHSVLLWYLMLAQLSHSNAACIRKKLLYAVGGRATVIRAEDPQWDIGEESKPLGLPERLAYRESLNEFFVFEGGVGRFHRRAGWSYEATGNAWIEMTSSETLGVRRVHLRVHRVTHCLYLNTKKGEMKVVAISPVWEADYLDKNPPRYVPLYPNFVRQDGDLKTMFHLKNGENEWYGRPGSHGGDLHKYREVQNTMYLIKQAAANFTGQLIIEVEDDDPDGDDGLENGNAAKAGFSGFQERFEANYSARADDPSSVLVTARPFGSRPMFVFQIAPNTNEKFYETTGNQSEAVIIGSHGLTQGFMGKDVSKGFSQDSYLGDYVMNVEPVINDLRTELTTFTNAPITAAWLDLLNMPEMNDRSITFMPPIQSQVEQFKKRSEAGPETAQQPQQQQPQQQNEPDNAVRGAKA